MNREGAFAVALRSKGREGREREGREREGRERKMLWRYALE